MKKKVAMMMAFALAIVLTANAGSMPKDEARQKAAAFLQQQGRSLKSQTPVARAPRKQAKSSDDAAYYVFDAADSQGFVIIAGDSDLPNAVLGFVDKGSFDERQMPKALKGLLELYAAQPTVGESAQVNDRRRALPSHKIIPQKLTTHWNQRDPYNNLCPEQGWDGRSDVGCLAVAMAQIMRYHQYPSAVMPSDIPAYTPPRIGTEMLALPAIQFDWTAMKDKYSSSDDATTVATLMLYCGQSVKMNYAVNSSAASDKDALYAFKNYFGYDDDIRLLYAASYTMEEWDNIIYNELKEDRPVMYSGRNTSGHEFVVDGYAGDGLYHVNWGWGYQDGNFSLYLMNPQTYSDNGFRYAQTAVIGIQKPDGQTLITTMPPENERHLIVNEQRIMPSTTSNAFQYWWANSYSEGGTYEYGIAEEDANGQLTVLKSQTETLYEYESTSTYDTYYDNRAPISNLPTGTHKLIPVSRLSGQSQWHRSNLRGQYVLAVIGTNDYNERMTKFFIAQEIPNGLTISNIDTGSGIFHNERCDIVLTIQGGTTDYVGNLYLRAVFDDDPTTPVHCANQYVIIPAGDQTEVKYNFPFYTSGNDDNNNWKEHIGAATLQVATDERGENIIGQKRINVSDIPEINREGDSEVTVSGTTATYRITLRNGSMTDYNGPLKAVLDDRNTEKTFSKTISLAADSQQEYEFTFENLSYSKSYYVRTYVTPDPRNNDEREVDSRDFRSASSLSVSNFAIQGEFQPDEPLKVSFTVTANTDYAASVQLLIYKSGNWWAPYYRESNYLDISAGESKPITFDNIRLDAEGEYEFIVCTYDIDDRLKSVNVNYAYGSNGISSISDNSQADAVFYDISGRRIVQPTRRGLYIQNGKKIIIQK